jgi:hypothetical protein
MPLNEILNAEEIDTVKIDGELCKLVHLEIRMPAQNNHYQALLMNAMISVASLVTKDKCGCDGNHSEKPGARVYKMAGNKPAKVTAKDCTHCAFINGRWWCIEWCW